MKETTKQKIRAYDNEYKKLNYKQYVIRFNKNTETKLIKQLDKQQDKTNYVKELIYNDMRGETK